MNRTKLYDKNGNYVGFFIKRQRVSHRTIRLSEIVPYKEVVQCINATGLFLKRQLKGKKQS